MENIKVKADGSNESVGIFVGYEREYGARSAKFDITDLATMWSGCTPSLWVTAPNGTVSYPAAITVEDNIVTWTFSSSDTAVSGRGSCRIWMTNSEGTVLGKSNLIHTIVLGAETETGETPSVAQGWIEQIISLKADIEESATAINTAAEKTAEMQTLYSSTQKSASDAQAALEELKEGIASGELKGDKGDKGDTGEKGKDGYSPTVSVSIDGSTREISITDVNGVHSYDVKDGVDGTNGTNGTPCTHSWYGTTLTVTSASGTSSANLRGAQGIQGIQGEKGQDGESPTAENIESALGYTPAPYWEVNMLKNGVINGKVLNFNSDGTVTWSAEEVSE